MIKLANFQIKITIISIILKKASESNWLVAKVNKRITCARTKSNKGNSVGKSARARTNESPRRYRKNSATIANKLKYPQHARTLQIAVAPLRQWFAFKMLIIIGAEHFAYRVGSIDLIPTAWAHRDSFDHNSRGKEFRRRPSRRRRMIEISSEIWALFLPTIKSLPRRPQPFKIQSNGYELIWLMTPIVSSSRDHNRVRCNVGSHKEIYLSENLLEPKSARSNLNCWTPSSRKKSFQSIGLWLLWSHRSQSDKSLIPDLTPQIGASDLKKIVTVFIEQIIYIWEHRPRDLFSCCSKIDNLPLL